MVPQWHNRGYRYSQSSQDRTRDCPHDSAMEVFREFTVYCHLRMCEIMIRLIGAMLILPCIVCAQAPAAVSDVLKGSLVIEALEFRKIVFNDSSKIDLCGMSRVVGHSEAIIKRITDRIGPERFKGSKGADCVPQPLGVRPGDNFNTLIVGDLVFSPGISDSVVMSYNLDRNPQNRVGLASLTLVPVNVPGGYGHGHNETYTFAIWQNGPGGQQGRFFLDVKFHHFGM